MKSLFGILAGLIVIGGTVPYLRDILRRETRPARSTWLLLTLLLGIDLFVQNDIGVGWALALTVGEVIACGSVFLLSIKYGVGGGEKLDIVSYILWTVMVGCWLVLDRPLLALHFGVAADAVSLAPTFWKSWKRPEEESKNVFIASSIAGLLGILACERLIYSNVLLPSYLFVVNGLIVLVLVLAENRRNAEV